MPGTITAVTVWLYGNSNLYEMPFDIYMKEVDKDAFSSSEDWVAVTASDIVYTGSVTVHNTDAQAYTFELTTPFAYSGSGNLLICFNNRTGQWAEGLNGKVFGAEGDAVRAIYARRDGSVYDPANLPAATLTTYQRDVVGLTIYVNGSFCFPPDNLGAVYTPGYSTLATLSWHQIGVAGSWVVEYGTASDFAGATQLTVSGTPSVALTALTAETTYYARVKAVCDVDEESDWSTTLTFTPLNSLLVSEPDTLDIGNRPAGAWMRPYRFTFGALVDGTQVDGMTIQGSGSSAIGLDSTGVTFPFSQNVGERKEFGITWGNEAAAVDGTVEVAYRNGGNIFSHDIVVRGNVYTPAVGDVWETAATVGTFPYNEDLNTATKPLYNNYQLPEEKIPDGKDVVYRLVFDEDVALSSRVTTGDHGKVALYSEGFAGVGGPDTGNIGKAEPPFEVQIGAGTNTTGYFPFYTLYNYSIAECLYRAAELEAAGVNTSPMTSLSWYATNSPGYEQCDIHCECE